MKNLKNPTKKLQKAKIKTCKLPTTKKRKTNKQHQTTTINQQHYKNN